MGVRESLTNAFLDRSFKGLSSDEAAERLAASGRALEAKWAGMSDTSEHRRLLRHIVGIERWGQSRLRVALGAPLAMDEYDDYQPPADAAWSELQAAFRDTRQQTIDLARQLIPAKADVKIPHNQFGKLTISSWLRYLDLHANMEAKKARR